MFRKMRPVQIPLRLFLITHTPVELGRPFPTPRTEELFARYKEHVKTHPYMPKEDVYN